MIELENVTRRFKNGKIKAVDDVSLTFPEKGLTFICGKSGSGKTTLIHLLGLFDQPTSGEIRIDGHNTADFSSGEKDTYRNSFFGFVSQDYGLIPELSVYENCALAPQLQSECPERIRERIARWLSEVGLAGYETRKINELSGGEKQRVSIVRCLAKSASVILCDEPTGNLDSDTAEEIFQILKKMSARICVIVVTHNRELAKKYGDRIISLQKGRIIEDCLLAWETSNPVGEKSHIPPKKRTGYRYIFRIALAEMRRQKMATAAICLMIVMIFSVLLVSNFMSEYSYPTTLSRTLVKNGTYSVPIGKYQCYDNGNNHGTEEFYEPITREEGAHLQAKNGDIHLGHAYTFGKTFYDFFSCDALTPTDYYCISFNQFTVIEDFRDLHYPLLYGAYPDVENGVLIFDYMVNNMLYHRVVPEYTVAESFIGYRLKDCNSGFEMVICGILQSDYAEYSGVSQGLQEAYYTNAHLSQFRGIFGGMAFESLLPGESKYYSLLGTEFQYANTVSDVSLHKIVHTDLPEAGKLLYISPDAVAYRLLISDADFAAILQIDRKAVTPELVRSVLDEEPWLSMMYGTSIFGYSGHPEYYTYDSYDEFGTGLMVGGIYYADEDTVPGTALLCSEGETIVKTCGEYVGEVLLLSPGLAKNSAVFQDLVKPNHSEIWWEQHPGHTETGYFVFTYYSFVLIDADDYLEMMATLLDKYGVYLLITTVLLLFFYAVWSVKNNQYTIGILKTNGVSNGTVVCIYSLQIFVTFLISVLLSVPGAFLLTKAVNAVFSDSLGFRYDFYGFNLHTFGTLVLYSFLVLVFALLGVFLWMLIQTPVRLVYQRKE